MDEKKAKKIKKRSVIIAIVCFMVVVMPVLWLYAIGPRDLTGGGEIYEQRVYYMFHTYRCVGWTMGGNNEVKSGPMIRPGLFQYYYLGEDTDYIIRKELHERFVFKREDKIKTLYQEPKKNAVEKVKIFGKDENSYIEFNGDTYVYLCEYDPIGTNELEFERYSTFGSVTGDEMSGHFSRIKNDYDMNFLLLDTVFDSDKNDVIYTKLHCLTYDELLGILKYEDNPSFSNEELDNIRNIFRLVLEDASAEYWRSVYRQN